MLAMLLLSILSTVGLAKIEGPTIAPIQIQPAHVVPLSEQATPDPFLAEPRRPTVLEAPTDNPTPAPSPQPSPTTVFLPEL